MLFIDFSTYFPFPQVLTPTAQPPVSAGQFRAEGGIARHFPEPPETALRKLKRALMIIAGTRSAIKLVQKTFAEIPELKRG